MNFKKIALSYVKTFFVKGDMPISVPGKAFLLDLNKLTFVEKAVATA